jgi:cell division septation protein DedD
VQVGALRSKADADALARRLSAKGYATYIVNPEAGMANPVYKVRVGNYTTQDEAERVKRKLQQEEKLQPWITH